MAVCCHVHGQSTSREVHLFTQYLLSTYFVLCAGSGLISTLELQGFGETNTRKKKPHINISLEIMVRGVTESSVRHRQAAHFCQHPRDPFWTVAGCILIIWPGGGSLSSE